MVPRLSVRVVRCMGKVTEEVIREYVSRCSARICAFLRDDLPVDMGLVQAAYYAYFHTGPARNPNIRLLQFLSTERNIGDAVGLAPLGRDSAYVVIADEDGEKVESCVRDMGCLAVDLCRGEFDAWRITAFALGLFK